MDEKCKKCCGFGGIAIFAFLALVTFTYLGLYAKSIVPHRTFNVSGEGKVVVVPDVAELSFGVLTEGGKDLAKLTKENNDKINLIIGSLKGSGVQEKDIVTEFYNISPRYQYFNCNPPVSGSAPCPPAEIVGYSVNQNVAVKIRDIKKAGDILSAVVERGANTVSGLSFIVEDPSAIQNQARAKAIVKAKETAALMASAGGFRLGKIVSVQEGVSSPQPLTFSDKMGMGGGGGAGIEPGTQDIRSTIALIYEIR